MKKTSLCLALLPVLLMGCVSAKRVIPESLLVCKDAPEVPAQGAQSRAVGNYIIDLYDAHSDCFTRLNGVRAIVAGENKPEGGP
ncbi:hypothetical protein ABID12_003077 [Martelella mangrovi]|uniref:Lipoprotein n=1 Tax=Martelella mangrovi TaxID=1397477 RepID=A0ABV2IEB4_9HYPH